MKICQECGKTLGDNAKFCNNCGAVLRTPDPQAAYQQTTYQQTAYPQNTYQQAPQVCPNCGQPQTGAPFCPNCGAPINQQPRMNQQTVQPKPKKSKAPIIAGVAAVAAVGAAAFYWFGLRDSGSGRSSSPQETFISAQQDLFVTPLLSALETEADTYGTGEFSSDITFSASVDSYEINQYLENSSITLKLDTDQGNLLANAELVLMGSPVLSGTLTYEDGKLGFYLPELDSNYYVVDLSSLAASAGMPGMDFSSFTLPEISGNDLRDLAETYLNVLYTIVTDDNVTVEQRQSITLPQLGASCTGTVYTFKPTARDAQAMLLNLADQLENDQKLRSLILDMLNGSLLAMSPYLSYDYYGYGGYSYDFEHELDQSLRELTAELRRQANSMDTTQDIGLIWTLFMEGDEVRMVRLENNYGGAIVFEQTGTAARGCTQTLYEQSSYGNHVVFYNNYTKQGGVYDGQVSFNNSYSDYYAVTVTYNMDTDRRSALGIPYGRYSLSMPYSTANITLEVSAGSRGGTDHVLSIWGDAYLFGGEFSRLDLTVNTTDRSSAQRPSQRPIDITNYSQSELESLFYALANRLQNAIMYAGY